MTLTQIFWRRLHGTKLGMKESKSKSTGASGYKMQLMSPLTYESALMKHNRTQPLHVHPTSIAMSRSLSTTARSFVRWLGYSKEKLPETFKRAAEKYSENGAKNVVYILTTPPT